MVRMLGAQNRDRISPRVYRLMLMQVALSPSFVAYPDDSDAPVAIVGFSPLADGLGELWFGVRDEGFGSYSRALVRLMRHLIEGMGAIFPGGIVCHVAEGDAVAEKLVRFVGGVRTDVTLGHERQWSF